MILRAFLVVLLLVPALAGMDRSVEATGNGVTCGVDVASDRTTSVFVAGSSEPIAAVEVPADASWVEIPSGSGGAPKFLWANDERTSDPEHAEFVRTIQGCQTPLAGALLVAGDDRYSAYWNGELVASCEHPIVEVRLTWCFETFRSAALVVEPGANELRIVARNIPRAPGLENPGMVEFRLTTELVSPDCERDVVSDDATLVRSEGSLPRRAQEISGPDDWVDLPAGPAGAPSYIWANADANDFPAEPVFHRVIVGCAWAREATLHVAGDDRYRVYWNGERVGGCTDPVIADPTTWCMRTYETIRVTLSAGPNLLKIEAHNIANGGYNPGMVVYRVTTS